MTTKIQWCDETWNPIRGCSRVSEGCRNCYAERTAARFSGEAMPYEGLVRRARNGEARWTGKVSLVESAIEKPLRWRNPRRIFVNSMSDLFHENVPGEWIDRIFAVMALCPQHTFIVLTKRPERMRDYLSDAGLYKRILAAAGPLRDWRPSLGDVPISNPAKFPLRNLHLGVSVEDQLTADERIPLLQDTPAAVRIVSYEPALGPVDFNRCSALGLAETGGGAWTDHGAPPALDQVIVGGESGPGARSCDVAWIANVVRDCRLAGVACFVKQLGANCGFTPEKGEWFQGHSTRSAEEVGYEGVRRLRNAKGGDPEEWPEDLRVREMPACDGRGA